jgi:hypothetical protein
MPATTYTVLVTVAHDHGAAPSTDKVEKMIERGLEEGVRELGSLESVSASAVEGDYLGVCRIGTPRVGRDNLTMAQARNLHAALRA